MSQRWRVFHVVSRAMRLRDVPFWMIRFLSGGGMAGGLDGRWIYFATTPEGGGPSSGVKCRLIRGGGLVTWISNIYEPHIPLVPCGGCPPSGDRYSTE